MDSTFTRYLFIALTVLVVQAIVRWVRNKIYKPKVEDGVQKPGKLERFIANLFIVLGSFLLLIAIMGFIAQEMEMALVMGGMSFLFFGITFILKRAHNTSYQENEEYFILRVRDKEHQVYYENIVDWKPSYNEISILDKMNPDSEFLRVNIKIFKPEILLRKIADMAYEGRFKHSEHAHPLDPDRKVETVYYLADNDYGYLVEDYLEEIESKSY